MNKTKREKLQKLAEVLSQLKEEFVELDETIDKIGEVMLPWFISPELITRPVIISLWGMTGTGKTSLIKRLVELLGIFGCFSYFDCSEINENGDSPEDDGSNSFVGGKILNSRGAILFEDTKYIEDRLKRSVLVFDEFQKLRSINNLGGELPSRGTIESQIWELIDKGKIELSQSSYKISKEIHERTFMISRLIYFIREELGDIKLDKNCFLLKKEDFEEKVIPSLGSSYLYLEHLISGSFEGVDLENLKETSETVYPIPGVFPIGNINKADYFSKISNINYGFCKKGVYALSLFPKLMSISPDYLYLDEEEDKKRSHSPNSHKTSPVILGDIIQELFDFFKDKEFNSTFELADLYEEYLDTMKKPGVVLDVSQSIIFVIGNLHAAYDMSFDISSDNLADEFKKRTEKVNVAKVRKSLLKLFRPEQVGRLGTNLIQYPSISSVGLKKVVDQELTKIKCRVRDYLNLELIFSKSVSDVLFSEGSIPALGVRPIKSITGLFNSKLSSKLTALKFHNPDITKLRISLKEEILEKGVAVFSITGDRVEEILFELELGNKNKKKKGSYIIAVHEMGHAIVNLHNSGRLPIQIVSRDTNGGGFTDLGEEVIESSLTTTEYINRIQTLLAGVTAENLVFNEGKKADIFDRSEYNYTTLGCVEDLEEAWEIIADLYRYDAIKLFNEGGSIESTIETSPCVLKSFGADERNSSGITAGIRDKKYEDLSPALKFHSRICTEILKDNMKLLANGSLVLAELGTLTGKEFSELVDKFGSPSLRLIKKRGPIDIERDTLEKLKSLVDD